MDELKNSMPLENTLREKQTNDLLLDRLNIIGEKVASNASIGEILQQVANCAAEELGADPVVLYQCKQNKATFVAPPIYAGKLIHQVKNAGVSPFKGTTFAELILAEGESLHFEMKDDIDEHIRTSWCKQNNTAYIPNEWFHDREGIQSMAALILKAGETKVGLMFLNYRQPHKFSESVKKRMNTFVAYAAVAITNSRLIARLNDDHSYLKRIIDRLPDPVFVTENKKINGQLVWRIKVANRVAHQLFGYDFSTNEFADRDARLLLGGDLDKLKQALQKANGEVTDLELSMQHSDGHRIPVSISTSVLMRNKENDHVTSAICVAKDLATKNRLDYLNRATLSLLEARSLEAAYDIIFENLNNIGYKKGMLSLVGEKTKIISGKRAIGRNWHDLLDKTNVPLKSGNVLAQVVKSGTPRLIKDCTTDPSCNHELTQQAGIKSQYIIPLKIHEEVIGTLQIDLTDKQNFLYGDKHHLTESLNVLSAFANQVAVAIESNRLKAKANKLQRSLADVGHEFRSPLHNIITQLGGLSYYLKKKYGQDQKVLDVVKIIEEESFRGDRQMKNALYSSEKSVDSMGQHLEKHRLSVTIQQCAARFQITARNRGISIVVRDNIKKIPPFSFDIMQIEQVFTNLIDNAVKYSHERQTVEIQGEDHGRKIEISIKNTGLGIPERSYTQIFEGFSRSDVLDSTRFIPGTGLGLKIAKNFVEQHKGKIWVISKPLSQRGKTMNYEGYLTTFFVLLPKNPMEY